MIRILVVIPTHDRTEFIAKAIDSVLIQTRPADDLVVVGNVTSAKHPDVKFIQSDEPIHTRLNTAIDSSDCDAFILLSDDDWLRPEYIERLASKMESTGADVVFDGPGTIQIPVTALVRKSIWSKVGGYQPEGFFDWGFSCACKEAGAKVATVPRQLFVYNQHPAQIAQHAKWKADGTWQRWHDAILAKYPRAMQQFTNFIT